MVTPLERPLRRAIRIADEDFIVTLLPDGLRLVRKGRRKGIEVSWAQILEGEVALAAQLAGSLASAPRRPEPPTKGS
jgi:hypothetical protein